MIYDLKTTFVDGAALTVTVAANTVLGNVLDIGSTASISGGTNVAAQWPNGGTAGIQLRDLGLGEDMYFVLRVRTAITLAATSTLQFKLTTDSAVALTTAPVDALSTPIYTNTSFAGGATAAIGTILLVTAIPAGTLKQFLGVRYTVGTANLTTAGAVDAFLTHDFARWIPYGQANLT